MRYICITSLLESDLSRVKDLTLSIRTSSEIRHLLRLAAEKEHRSCASMIEVLVLEYAREHKLQPISPENQAKATKRSK